MSSAASVAASSSAPATTTGEPPQATGVLTCYNPDGSNAYDAPCTSDAVAACCDPTWHCAAHGLCVSNDFSSVVRGSCTDHTYPSDSECASNCLDDTGNPYMTECPNDPGYWYCDSLGSNVKCGPLNHDLFYYGEIQTFAHPAVSGSAMPSSFISFSSTATTTASPSPSTTSIQSVTAAAISTSVDPHSTPTTTATVAGTNHTPAPTAQAKSSIVGPAVGGAVGGGLALALIAILIYWLWSRKKKQKATRVPGTEHSAYTDAQEKHGYGGQDVSSASGMYYDPKQPTHNRAELQDGQPAAYELDGSGNMRSPVEMNNQRSAI